MNLKINVTAEFQFFTCYCACNFVLGLFLILALGLFPAGWGSEKVQHECGWTSAAFYVSISQVFYAVELLFCGVLKVIN